MTQRPCRVGDTVEPIFNAILMHVVDEWTQRFYQSKIEAGVMQVSRCGQCGKAVPSECRCFEDSETGGE